MKSNEITKVIRNNLQQNCDKRKVIIYKWKTEENKREAHNLNIILFVGKK